MEEQQGMVDHKSSSEADNTILAETGISFSGVSEDLTVKSSVKNNPNSNDELAFIEEHRKRDATMFAFVPGKYGTTCRSLAVRKEAQLLRTICSTNLYVLDPGFINKCKQKLTEETNWNDEQEATRRKQEWAKRYYTVRHLFGGSKEGKKYYRTKHKHVHESSDDAPPKYPQDLPTQKFEDIKKKIKDIGFYHEEDIMDDLCEAHRSFDLYETANDLLLDGPAFPNLKMTTTT